jgi:hypothetical protein
MSATIIQLFPQEPPVLDPSPDRRIARIRQLQVMTNGAPAALPEPAPRILTDPEHWRKRRREHLYRLRRKNCPVCNGTGEIMAATGPDDCLSDPCPRCTPRTAIRYDDGRAF